MIKRTHPRWIENKPKKNRSICYFAVGYGCISIGESGDPLKRFRSTLSNKKWATLFLWVNLHQFGIFDSMTRAHLEALMIFSAAKKEERWGIEFCLVNGKYTRTLGNFSRKEFYNVALVDTLLSNFMNYIRSNVDPRGNFLTDNATWYDESETVEAREAAYLRLSKKFWGHDRVGKSVRCLELRLSPYREE